MSDTFFQKKTLYASITGLFLGLLLLSYPFFISATDFLNEDFNSYSNGSLTGQGGWLFHSMTSSWQVQDTTSFTGKAVRCAEATATCGNDINLTSSPSGSESFWIYEKTIAGRNCRQARVQFDEDSYTSPAINFMVFWNTTTSKCELRLHQSYGATILDDDFTNFDSWFRVDIEWDFATQKVRARTGDSVYTGKWTAWVDPGYGGWTTGLNRLTLYSDLQNRGDSYIDQFSSWPYCAPDHCSYCLTGETCLANNCIWDYNSAYERWECHQEWIPYIPGCGTGFEESCWGCYTQETCESAIPTGVCEWVDRGYGTACYPTEEALEEAAWEAPELEDCDLLEGAEMWLCKIKNFIAELFLPTQEKVDNLKQTIDNFKTKFPFNYASSLSVFFNTIKTSLDTPKDIPVEIFGNPGNLNFDFLEATETIGGTPETIKNILFDFTTALIVIGFLFWIISFIKRIF